MVRLEFSTQLSYEVFDDACDFVFNIQAALTPRQRVVRESLQFSQGLCATFHTDPSTFGRFMRLRAGRGSLTVSYARSSSRTGRTSTLP